MQMNSIGTPATKEEFDAMFKAYREYLRNSLKLSAIRSATAVRNIRRFMMRRHTVWKQAANA